MPTLDTYTIDLTESADSVFMQAHRGKHSITHTFPKDTPMSDLIQWLSDRPAWTLSSRLSAESQHLGSRIRYCHETGLLILGKGPAPGTFKTYDPLREEDLIKLVRQLQREAGPLPRADLPTLPGLPTERPEHLIQRFTHAQSASGSGHRPRPRAGSSAAFIATPEATEAGLDALLNDL